MPEQFELLREQRFERQASPSFARCDTAAGLERLRADLASGAWQARNGELMEMDELDIGYRMVVATQAR